MPAWVMPEGTGRGVVTWAKVICCEKERRRDEKETTKKFLEISIFLKRRG